MAMPLTIESIRADIEQKPMRDIVDAYPAVMPVLASHGLDLCCGGGHTIPEAARLHGLDEDALVAQVVDRITASGT